MADLFAALIQIGAFEVDKAARLAVSLPPAGGTDNHLRLLRPRMFLLPAILHDRRPLARLVVKGCRLAPDFSGRRGCPAPVAVYVAADFADQRFSRSASRPMASGFMVHAFGPRFVCISLVAFTSSHD